MLLLFFLRGDGIAETLTKNRLSIIVQNSHIRVIIGVR